MKALILKSSHIAQIVVGNGILIIFTDINEGRYHEFVSEDYRKAVQE